MNQIRWKDDPKAYFKNYHSQIITCECGKRIKKGSKSNHVNSLQHRLTMFKINEIKNEPMEKLEI